MKTSTPFAFANTTATFFMAIALPLAMTTGISPPAFAQADIIEEVVVTGSRREARSVYASAAPIDVIGGDDFRNQGNTDMTDLLRTVVPSFNVNTQPISDAATVIRPANLRGLAPDHTLVLLNGKRRHRASVITWLGNGVSDGAQGPDISVIPAIALKQVEVLRDGASAQYGSDAIAGVMNFILKDDAEGSSVEVRYGAYSEDSESVFSVSGNIGLPLTSDGFFNASFEYGESEETVRSVQRDDARELIEGGNTAVQNPAQKWGSPEVNGDFKGIFNLAVSLSDNAQAYAFGNYASKEVDGGFYFRNPDTRSAVFSLDSGETRLVGDTTEDMSGNCPVVPVGDAQALASVIANPNCFVFNELFPGGFTPRFGADTKDAALVAGVRGERASGLGYDVSVSFGMNDADFFIYNTVNSSLGPRTPTSFNPGDYTQNEYNFNADFTYPVDVAGFASDLNIAGGVEYRIEQFEITAGQVESWDFGPLAGQGFSAGSNGFPGFSPSIAGDWSRKNYAAYLDLEADVTRQLLVGLAIRYEDFEDFGNTVNGKVAFHYSLSDSVGLRGTYSTGFRAPTPGQQNASNTSTEFNFDIGDLVNRGTIPSNSIVAQQRGGTDLAEEESTNITFGIVFNLENLDVTVDFYNIEVDDRIALTRDFELNDMERQALIDAGVFSASNIQDFRFFQNAFDTKTRGVDVVATYPIDMLNGVTDLSLAFNKNDTEVDSFDDAVIDAARIRELEEGLPESRWNTSAVYISGNWRVMLRANWVDDWYDSEDSESYDGYYTLDTEVGYSVGNGLTLIFGGQNFTDETPDDNPNAAGGVGNQYSQFSPLGFNGAFFYGRAVYDF